MGVWEGWAGVKVREGGGVSVTVFEFCVAIIPVGVLVIFNKGGGIMKGVAVIMAGVMEGMGDWTGNGCGDTPQRSQDERRRARKIIYIIRFIK